MRLRIGTRGSRLALWQSHHVASLLRNHHGSSLNVEVCVISTAGDRNQHQALPEIGGKGLFTAELEASLRDGDIDLAVHSLKDLPTDLPPDLALLAHPERADARDALVLRADHAEKGGRPDPRTPFAALPDAAVIGTSSLRRSAQLFQTRPDLKARDIRGNVETRLRKMDEGHYDGVLLACAGLDRLGLGGRIHMRLERPWLCAPAQGAIAIQGRAGDPRTCELVGPVDHQGTRFAVEAERTVLSVLEGGCSLPLGAWCRHVGDRLVLEATLMSPDGMERVSGECSGPVGLDEARGLGRSLGQDLLDRGASAILARHKGSH